MRRRLVFTAVIPLAVVGFGGVGSASAAPPAPTTNHGQCVSSTPTPSGSPGRSVVAKNKKGCTTPVRRPLVCEVIGTVERDRGANEVTVTGTGPGSDGSALQCTTDIDVSAGDTISFDYTFGENTDPCGGGVPRLYAVIDGKYFNTFDDNPNECEATTGSFTLPVTGTVTEVGFVYDRGDFGSVTYSNAKVGSVVLDI
jgi:hypothetical protein